MKPIISNTFLLITYFLSLTFRYSPTPSSICILPICLKRKFHTQGKQQVKYIVSGDCMSINTSESEVIPSQKYDMNTGPIINGYGATDIWNSRWLQPFESSSIENWMKQFLPWSKDWQSLFNWLSKQIGYAQWRHLVLNCGREDRSCLIVCFSLDLR
jgi:hypothetical protein